jgi:signal transduction histidine kinase
MVCGTALMKEAFCNIINNAIRHSKKDVTIDIAVEETTRDGKKFYDTIISDNGPGIPNELKAKIFNRFQRGETKAHGRGLGLFIVHSLVERAGGNVSAEDRIPGDYTKGAKFVVSLPAAEECK